MSRARRSENGERAAAGAVPGAALSLGEAETYVGPAAPPGGGREQDTGHRLGSW